MTTMNRIKAPHPPTDSVPLLDELDGATELGTAGRLAGRACCWCPAPPEFTIVITSKVPV